MDELVVQWSAGAREDTLGIAPEIAHDSPEVAAKVFGQLEGRCLQLATNPRRGRIVPELKAVGVQELREVVVRPWRVMYRIDETSVTVMAVIDSRRNVADILLEVMLR